MRSRNEIIKTFEEHLNLLSSDKEISTNEVSKLLNILKDNTSYKNETISFLFLNKMKELYNNRIVNYKNRKNFEHLTNIINNICIQENVTKTNNLIIDVSQLIKYQNLFLYCMIQNKNPYFKTKTFWQKLIRENIEESLNNYASQIFSKKINLENNDNLVLNHSNIISKMGLDKTIPNYNKFNEEQKSKMNDFAYKSISIIISKSILNMCPFLVPEFVIMEIINEYHSKVNFGVGTLHYFSNLLEVKNVKNTSNMKEYSQKYEKMKLIEKYSLIISCTIQFLNKTDYIKLILLSKELKKDIEIKIYKFILSNQNLNIESRIKIWGIILQVDKSIQKLNYSLVKKTLQERINKNIIQEESQEFRNMFTIDNDLNRTPFIKNLPNYREKLEWVLKCLNWASPDFGYYQGMNNLSSFLFQLLDYDEEKTFHYMYTLETNTEYHNVFKGNINVLNTFFDIFDKIFYFYCPEIYYKFLDGNISTSFFSTPWFVTLFTKINYSITKDNVPKYLLMIFESFLLNGWSAIFNYGFTLTKYFSDKILNFEDSDRLISYMITGICSEDIHKNEQFSIIKQIFEKNSNIIDESLISRLNKIIKFEESHSYIKK
jgi:hypothetical protein